MSPRKEDCVCPKEAIIVWLEKEQKYIYKNIDLFVASFNSKIDLVMTWIKDLKNDLKNNYASNKDVETLKDEIKEIKEHYVKKEDLSIVNNNITNLTKSIDWMKSSQKTVVMLIISAVILWVLKLIWL